VKAPVRVRRDVVLAVQEQLIASFGGAAGLREGDARESALAPQQRSGNAGSSTIFDLAAADAVVLIKKQPFAAGNKRLAFTVAVMFLELNGYRVDATEADAVLRTMALAAGEMTEDEYAGWLKARSQKYQTGLTARKREP
jgi:death on curing protein